MKKNKYAFWVLVSIVAISGFSQGMLLPLIAVIFEKSGISSGMNGMNATALYIGILLASPFMEQPLRKFGYKNIILFGGLLVVVALALFPLWQNFWFWLSLRFFIGIGDHALHFATQTWITSSAPEAKRGRHLSLYGLFFGIGFAAGPLMTPLVDISISLPFIVSSIMCLVGWVFIFLLKNEYPENEEGVSSFKNTGKRFSQALKYGWVTFLPPLAYGFLESSLNGIFPVYALRTGIEVSEVSILLTSFAVGGIITQLPLGMLSDRFGRRKVLMVILFLGFASFSTASFLEESFVGLFICFLSAGMVVGSTFSLGIAFMTDIMPKNLLPTGNLLCGIAFSLGSLTGPSIGGVIIQAFKQISFFHIVSTLLFSIFLVIVVFGKQSKVSLANEKSA